MIESILANALSGILNEVLGAALKQPIKQLFDEREMQRSLTAAIKRAEERFSREYHAIDAELANALIAQTRFADIPNVQLALKEMITHPFRDPTQVVVILQRSFHDVLPSRVDRARVDAAVTTFLQYLGEEVLYIPQLQHLYQLAFQKVNADSSRNIAANTGALVESIQGLREDIRQLPVSLISPSHPAIEGPDRNTNPRQNLPQRPYTHFIGRETELQKLTQLLLPYPRSRHFLVTLDGIGGVGKSALALEIAYRYRDHYTSLPSEERFEAIIWISAKRTLLTANKIQQRQQTFSTLEDLYREIATVLELPQVMQVGTEQRRGLIDHALSRQRTLLIVDNLETVDDEEVLTFLRELPDPTKAIVTTRHRIDIAYAIRLNGMPHTDALALIELEAADKSVDLPSDAIEGLYRRTGGIPLAIVWSIALMSLGYRVESVLHRLGSGHSDITRFCFEESIAHIRDRDAYRVLAALAMFEASVKRQMLGDIAGLGNDEIGRDDALAELLRLSLVNQERDRFSLLPLTRSFVLDELERQSELEHVLREQWIAYFTEFSRPYAGLHWLGKDLQLVRREGIHLVTLTVWCQQSGRIDVLGKIISALCFYLDMTGQWTEMFLIGRIVLEHAQLTGDLESVVFTETHILSWVLSQQGQHKEAERYLADALVVARRMADVGWQCEILGNLSQTLRRFNKVDLALDYIQQAIQLLPLLMDSEQQYARASVEYEIGKIYRDMENWQEAQTHFYLAQDVFRNDETEPVFNMELAWGVLSNLGYVEHHLGHFDVAEQMYLKSLSFFRDLGSKGNLATTLVRLAALEEQRGNGSLALTYAREALDWSRQLSLVMELEQAGSICTRLSEVNS